MVWFIEPRRAVFIVIGENILSWSQKHLLYCVGWKLHKILKSFLLQYIISEDYYMILAGGEKHILIIPDVVFQTQTVM